MHISASTIDDLLHRVLKELLKSRHYIRPTRSKALGKATESVAAMLRLTNPRARLSRSETKCRLSSCLGELLWYLAKSNDLGFIKYYLSRYGKESEDGKTIHGAYGPRLFAMDSNNNQIKNVLDLLSRKPNSRRAVIQLFDAADLAREYKEIPCTCTLQFMIRRGHLHMVTHMRSNDAFLGLPHDIFGFTMLQEIFAQSLGVKLGEYHHAVGSLHLYKAHRKSAAEYIGEGWHSTQMAMPPMPKGDPWRFVDAVVKAEKAIRNGRNINIHKLNLPPYWADLVRVLQAFSCFTRKQLNQIERIKIEMSGKYYNFYIDDLITRLRQKQVRRQTSKTKNN